MRETQNAAEVSIFPFPHGFLIVAPWGGELSDTNRPETETHTPPTILAECAFSTCGGTLRTQYTLYMDTRSGAVDPGFVLKKNLRISILKCNALSPS